MTHEKVHFRVFQLPCCGGLICWVNTRLPNYCPECGEQIFLKLKIDSTLTMVNDDNAWLNYKGGL